MQIVINEDLHIRPYRKRKIQNLTAAQKNKKVRNMHEVAESAY